MPLDNLPQWEPPETITAAPSKGSRRLFRAWLILLSVHSVVILAGSGLNVDCFGRPLQSNWTLLMALVLVPWTLTGAAYAARLRRRGGR